MSRITITFENAETFNEFLLQNKSLSSDPAFDADYKKLEDEYSSLLKQNRELEMQRIKLLNENIELSQKIESLFCEIENMKGDNSYLEEKIKDLEEDLGIAPYKML